MTLRVKKLYFIPVLLLLILAVYFYMRPVTMVNDLVNTGYNFYDSGQNNKR